MKNPFRLLSRFEILLWICSLAVILLSFLLAKGTDWLTLAASLVGATALIFVSKGEVLGQILTVVFSILYAIISWSFRYYGEMITYLGMSMPIAILSVVSWLRHPYEAGKTEVRVARLSGRQVLLMFVLAAAVTAGFYFVLEAFDTANLAVSTVSVTTSFLASWLMLFRSPWYALAYAANDVVLIILWVLATLENAVYLPVVVCFVIFFVNDAYGFFNWTRILKRQTKKESGETVSHRTPETDFSDHTTP